MLPLRQHSCACWRGDARATRVGRTLPRRSSAGLESACALRRHFTGGPTQWEQVDDAAIEASGKRLAALYSTKTGEDGACPPMPRTTRAARLAPQRAS